MSKKKKISIKSYEDHVKYVEKKMGMSIDDFHQKLEESITDELLSKAKENQEFLDQWLADGLEISCTQDKDVFLDIRDGERFVPCFDPELSGRNELPENWFYSNYDNLVTVRHNNKGEPCAVYWLPPLEYDSLRGYRGFPHRVTGQQKKLYHYEIASIIWGRDNFFGDAMTYLDRFGLYAYGGREDPWAIQSHHPLNLGLYPDERYNHDNVQGLVTMTHNLLHYIKKNQKEAREAKLPEIAYQIEMEMAQKIMSHLREQTPEQPVLIMTGERYDRDYNYIDSDGAYQITTLPADKANQILSKDQRQYIQGIIQGIQILAAMD